MAGRAARLPGKRGPAAEPGAPGQGPRSGRGAAPEAPWTRGGPGATRGRGPGPEGPQRMRPSGARSGDGREAARAVGARGGRRRLTLIPARSIRFRAPTTGRPSFTRARTQLRPGSPDITDSGVGQGRGNIRGGIDSTTPRSVLHHIGTPLEPLRRGFSAGITPAPEHWAPAANGEALLWSAPHLTARTLAGLPDKMAQVVAKREPTPIRSPGMPIPGC